METILLPLAGVLGVLVALAHGYLGETRIIAAASFPSRQAKALVRAIWQLSTVTWALGSLAIAAAPSLIAESATRQVVVAVAILPMLWGIIANAWITKGRHFGWMALAVVVGLAVTGVSV